MGAVVIVRPPIHMFRPACRRCKIVGGFVSYATPMHAKRIARHAGWYLYLQGKDQHVCPDCREKAKERANGLYLGVVIPEEAKGL